MSTNVIRVVGARVHNLKKYHGRASRNKLVVITGLSGSGNLHWLSIPSRRRPASLRRIALCVRPPIPRSNEQADVDHIDGLSPAVSIDQKGTSHNPRSTVGTVTRIYDYLRLLFARRASRTAHLWAGSRQASAQEIVDAIESLPNGSRILVLAPVVRGRKGTYQAGLRRDPQSRLRACTVDGTVHSLDDEITLDRYKQHDIDAVVDRLVISNDGVEEDKKAARTRLTDSVETALKFGEGYLTIASLETANQQGLANRRRTPILVP